MSETPTPADPEEAPEAPEAEESAATVADLPSTVRSTHAEAASQHATTLTQASFVDVLHSSEIERTLRFAPIMLVMGVVIALILTLLGGHPTAKAICYAAIGVGDCALIYLYSLARRPHRFTETRVGLAYGVCILTLYAAVYYFGAFSAAVAIIILGLFFTGLGRSARVAALLYVLSFTVQAGLGVAIITGLIPDHGLLTASDMSIDQQLAVQAAIQVVFLVTYLVARATRVQLSHAVADHEGAVRQVARRDALLEEARLELHRAKRVGGPGRYTGQVFGSFVLGSIIGRGAMGDVYEASHRESGDPAAVKLLQIAALGRPELLRRFLREAEVVARLDSPYIVKLLEVSDADSVLPYLAMERLVGTDLGARLRSVEPFSIEMVVDMVTDVARGLEAAREAGIVHRDIKPQNLFMAETKERAVWKILDFGVSKIGNAGDDGTLTHGQVIGTPAYMAPEQAQGHTVDHRTDLYALGTVTYRALTLQPPFPGKDIPSVLRDVVGKMPVQPSEVAELPEDVDRVLAIVLAKRPEDRFSTAIEFADALSLAVKEKLPRALRARADELIDAFGWGGRLELRRSRRRAGRSS